MTTIQCYKVFWTKKKYLIGLLNKVRPLVRIDSQISFNNTEGCNVYLQCDQTWLFLKV